jgi:transposase
MTTGDYDSIALAMGAPDMVSDGVDTLRAELAAERAARQEAEARASSAEAMVAHLKLVIAKLRHDHYGASPPQHG